MLTGVLCTLLAVAPAAETGTDRVWHAGGAAGYLFWQEAYGGHDTAPLLRVAGGRKLSGWLPWGEWLVARAAIELSWKSDETRSLEFSHTATTLTLAVGGTYSYLLLRAEALFELGALIETMRRRETGAVARSDVAASLCLGGHGGLGLAYRDVAVLMVRSGVRTRASRLDIFMLLGVDWHF